MSFAEYYNRLEKVALEIQEERERAPKYFLTLWWGLDGLQEREDGTWAWINRRKKETPAPPAFVPWPSVWNTQPVRYYSGRCQESEADRFRISCSQTQNVAQCFLDSQSGVDCTIMQLQSELASVNYNIAINQQHQRLVEMLNQSCTNNLKGRF